MKFARSPYVLRPGGIAYAKAVRFDAPTSTTVILVRSARTGRLLRVERRRKP